MADKSFGVKEINLIGASGTPTIESPNNLNINAINVAISTDISVGGQLSLGTGTSISSPGSNILTLGTNSVERVRINSTGVGIKTNDPDAPLTIQESGDVQIRLKNSSGTTKAYLGTAGAFGSGSTDDLRIRSEGNILFGSAGSEKMRMLSGGGLTFNGDTAAANALDDYEEGTWTPELADAGSGGNLVTHSVQNGLYTKVGNIVTVYFRVTWTSKASASGNVHLRGFPFAAKATTGNYSYYGSTANSNGQNSVSIEAAQSRGLFWDTSGNVGTFAELAASDTGIGMNGSITYLAG